MNASHTCLTTVVADLQKRIAELEREVKLLDAKHDIAYGLIDPTYSAMALYWERVNELEVPGELFPADIPAIYDDNRSLEPPEKWSGKETAPGLGWGLKEKRHE
jgi:hypothetical protein